MWSKWKKDVPEDMLLRRTGPGSGVQYGTSSYGTCVVEWYLPADEGRVRRPQETAAVYSVHGGFNAAGKHYTSLSQLCLGENRDTCRGRDIYGREVLCLKERFPCVDSYDLLYENRYFRWFFIRRGNSLTRVYYTDERDHIYVTEDVGNLENKCWEQMCRLRYAAR